MRVDAACGSGGIVDQSIAELAKSGKPVTGTKKKGTWQ